MAFNELSIANWFWCRRSSRDGGGVNTVNVMLRVRHKIEWEEIMRKQKMSVNGKNVKTSTIRYN